SKVRRRTRPRVATRGDARGRAALAAVFMGTIGRPWDGRGKGVFTENITCHRLAVRAPLRCHVVDQASVRAGENATVPLSNLNQPGDRSACGGRNDGRRALHLRSHYRYSFATTRLPWVEFCPFPWRAD